MSVVRGLPRVFRESRAILAESIVWDAEAGDLLWCDITAGLLHRSPFDGSRDGADDTVLRLPPPLASFHLAADGGYVASLGDSVVLVDGHGVITRQLATIGHAHPGVRMNEGKVDPFGRWVSGSMDVTTGEPDAAIYSIDAAGDLRLLYGGLGVANGFEWTPDGRTMYFGDTSVKTIYRGDYGPAGDLTEIEPLHVGESHDGLTTDDDGCLWSGIYGGGKVVRYSPAGDELETVELPAPNITSVAFGGPDLSTLFVASARENLSEQQLEQHPLSGAIFAVDTSAHGKRPHSFGVLEPSALREEWKGTE